MWDLIPCTIWKEIEACNLESCWFISTQQGIWAARYVIGSKSPWNSMVSMLRIVFFHTIDDVRMSNVKKNCCVGKWFSNDLYFPFLLLKIHIYLRETQASVAHGAASASQVVASGSQTAEAWFPVEGPADPGNRAVFQLESESRHWLLCFWAFFPPVKGERWVLSTYKIRQKWTWGKNLIHRILDLERLLEVVYSNSLFIAGNKAALGL